MISLKLNIVVHLMVLNIPMVSKAVQVAPGEPFKVSSKLKIIMYLKGQSTKSMESDRVTIFN